MICGCRKCLEGVKDEATGAPALALRMTLCPICGNKRYPHATDHHNPCTGSNERGQPGSFYR